MFESINPLDINNLMVSGCYNDEININNAKEAFYYLKDNYGRFVDVSDIDNALYKFNVDYVSLPFYAKEWFDYFDIAEE